MTKYIETLNDVPPALSNSVLVIGNFDGVHKGHRELLECAANKAAELNAPRSVLTFEPHPRSLLRPDDPPFRLTPAPLKRELLQKCGLDMLICLDFNWDFASQTADQFVENVLARGIRPAHIVVGHDFRFGQMRQGTPQDITDKGIPVTVLDKVADEGGDFSSSRIRQALRKGRIEEANALLGWQWEMRGTVVKGDQRGRELGYPTANVHLGDTLHPSYGVYATQVKIMDEDSAWMPAATNIGIRPMFEVKVGQIEAHILDFDGDLYGKTLRIRPVEKIRGEARFDSLEKLIAQIEDDCRKTRGILAA